MRIGLGGFAGLSLPQLLAIKEQQARAGQAPARRSAVLVVWLHGGASHIETYDPKPDAPIEYRGPYGTIDTKVPGLRICELLPRQSSVMDKFTVLRSLVHTGFCHDDGPQQLFTGHPDQGRRLKPQNPDLLCITNYLRSDPTRRIPNYVGVGPIPYLGSAYLGPSFEPFAVSGNPDAPQFEVPNVGLKDTAAADRLSTRLSLRVGLDRLERELDRTGNMAAMDRFEAQAWNLLTGSAAREAFAIDQEPDKVRERYGRHAWGQQCLLARRLIEAGVELVTVTLNGPLCGRVQNWDDHAVNHHVFEGLKYRTPFFDQALAALVKELHERGLNEHVLLIVGGDFGRTPKISYAPSSGEGVASGPAGTIQPGRDHWPSAMSFLFSGGGITPGQVIGATDARGEHAIERRVGVQDFVATIYQHLGIDATRVEVLNFAGRPVPILQDGKPIPELTRA